MTQEKTQEMATVDKSQVTLSNPEQMQRFEPTDLRSISTWDDAIRLLQTELGAEAIDDAQDSIGDGFAMLDDKDRLIDVPLIFVQWVFTPGDYGKQYAIARVVTDRGDKFIITDGGTGFCQQLAEYTERTGKTAGLLAKRGLRKSTYVNEFGPGTTHYINV